MKIAIVDSGVRRSHPILKGKRIESLQYEQGSVVPAPWDNDSYGHGTAVAAIISQCHADAELTVIGIPSLEEGLEESDLIWVLRYIRETQHADIVNLSLGLNVCEQYEDLYPGYEFASNKGYGSARHIAALKSLGPCPIHRRSFIGNFVDLAER